MCQGKSIMLTYTRRIKRQTLSYNRFVELESRVFFQMMFFLNLSAFGR
jgi:hypothetical protein